MNLPAEPPSGCLCLIVRLKAESHVFQVSLIFSPSVLQGFEMSHRQIVEYVRDLGCICITSCSLCHKNYSPECCHDEHMSTGLEEISPQNVKKQEWREQCKGSLRKCSRCCALYTLLFKKQHRIHNLLDSNMLYNIFKHRRCFCWLILMF